MLGRGQPVHETHGVGMVDPGKFLRVNGNEGNPVQQHFVPFNKYGQPDRALKRQVGSPVNDGIRLDLIGELKGRYIPFVSLLVGRVPGSGGFTPALFQSSSSAKAIASGKVGSWEGRRVKYLDPGGPEVFPVD